MHFTIRTSDGKGQLPANHFYLDWAFRIFWSFSLPSLFFIVFLRITSWRTTFNSQSCLVLHERDSIPIGSLHWFISNLVCVCVEHLNRCKTSSWSYSKQGACGCHANACQRSYAWQWKHSLINCVYLQFSTLNSGCICSIGAFFFRLSYLHLGHHEKYVAEDSLLCITNLILLAWDSVPDRSYEGSILV